MKVLAVSLISVLVSLLALEGAIRLWDPWGLIAYQDDLATLNPHLGGHMYRGYVLAPGTYRLSNWTATETDRYERLLPNASNQGCKVVLLGDSVAWGYGVSDPYTWANLTASKLPYVQLVDPAYPGYNSENIKGIMLDYPDAQAFLYLVIDNDDEPANMPLGASAPSGLSALSRYLIYQVKQSSKTVKQPERFKHDIAIMLSDPRVALVAFDEPWAHEQLAGYKVRFIPYYTHWISRTDGHPNNDGNQEIAASILPIVQQIVNEKCPVF